MWNQTVIGVLVTASMTLIGPAGRASGQTTRPENVTGLDRPAARAAFEQLLDQLDAVRLDPALADADEIAAARAKLKTAIGQFNEVMTDDWITDRGMTLADRDYVSFRNACSPRLNGTVVRIGPGQPFQNIASALPSIKPGTLVLLGNGEFNIAEFGRRFNFADIAIVGQGPKVTTLTGEYGDNPEKAARLMIDNLRIDCKDSPIVDLRRGGFILLRDCLVENYNSGAGGSNSIFMNNGTCLLEGCAFDGSKGRSAGRGSAGNAMDLRDDFLLYCRQCQFIENSDIVRVTAPATATFDGCTALNMTVDGYGLTSFSNGRIIIRDSPSIIDASQGRIPVPTKSMAVATDDLRLVEHAAGIRPEADADMEALVTGLALDRRLPYWIGLLRHDDGIIRAIAAKRLGELIDEPATLPAAAVEGETLADLGVLLECEVECARMLAWLEMNRGQLHWDETAGRYRVRPK